jgi:MOSC domain-containing protein YiiM
VKHHGGGDQAVYAYAREDLDWWQDELGAPLRSGMFGENLTTTGLAVSGALIGETWRIGDDVLVQVTSPRVPCSTFSAWINRKGWLQAFIRASRPGAYLRVLSGGALKASDPMVVEFRPSHSVTVEKSFRALTLEPDLLPGLLEASQYLNEELLRRSKNREPFVIA